MNIAIPVGPAPGKRSRASAYAAGTVASRVMPTAPTATRAVFRAQAPNQVWLNRRSKCLSVGGR